MPYGIGWATAHPKEIFNGGDPSGDVRSIHWSHWGAATATGHGLGAGFKPQGVLRPAGQDDAQGIWIGPMHSPTARAPTGHCGSSSRSNRAVRTTPGGPRGPA